MMYKLLMAGVVVVGGFFLALNVVLASTASLFVDHLAFNMNENSGWKHSIDASNGQFVALYVEVQTQPGTNPIQNLSVKIDLPGSFVATVTTNATASSTTSGVVSRTDSATIGFRGNSCKLIYEPGSTTVQLDRNRDGSWDFDGGWATDTITTGGINLGDFGTSGNGGVLQIRTKQRVECAGAPSPSPTPSPSPSPSPVASPSPTPVASPSPTPVASPSPTPGGGVQCPGGFSQQLVGNVIMCVQNTNTNTNTNTNSQTQTNNQTVTVNNPAVVPAVLGASVPRKQPETGLGVLGLLSMFGAGPVGMALARYGKGRVKAREEDWTGVAMGLLGTRRATHH